MDHDMERSEWKNNDNFTGNILKFLSRYNKTNKTNQLIIFPGSNRQKVYEG